MRITSHARFARPCFMWPAPLFLDSWCSHVCLPHLALLYSFLSLSLNRTAGTVTRDISFVLVQELSESGRWIQHAHPRLTREGVDSDILLARTSQASRSSISTEREPRRSTWGGSTRFDWPVPLTATEQVSRASGRRRRLRCGHGV